MPRHRTQGRAAQRAVNRCSVHRPASRRHPAEAIRFWGRSSRPPSSTSGVASGTGPVELKYRSLVVVSVLAATGHNEELKTHLRGALKLGWTVDELREALLQTAPYAGFSAANEALQALSAVATRG